MAMQMLEAHTCPITHLQLALWSMGILGIGDTGILGQAKGCPPGPWGHSAAPVLWGYSRCPAALVIRVDMGMTERLSGPEGCCRPR